MLALNFKILLKFAALNQQKLKNLLSDFAKMRVNNFCLTAELVS